MTKGAPEKIYPSFIDEGSSSQRERESESGRGEKKESIRFFLAPAQWITYKECAIKIQTYVLFRLFLSPRPVSDMYISIYIYSRRTLLFYIEQQEVHIASRQ